jgi:predicted branched-subunit amino acid permease
MPLNPQNVAVKTAVTFFFLVAIIGIINNLSSTTCATRAITAAILAYVTIKISLKIINKIVIKAIIENQMNKHRKNAK